MHKFKMCVAYVVHFCLSGWLIIFIIAGIPPMQVGNDCGIYCKFSVGWGSLSTYILHCYALVLLVSDS